ncbi:MAG: 2-oxoglutarate and iron-dependent oxygenase domain-containing protein [Pseudomonadota bacterium]
MTTTDLFKPIPYALFAEDKTAFAEALGQSFRETGFAVIEGHSVPQAVIDDNLAAAKAFFALPDDTKRRYDDSAGGGQRGYTAFGAENAKGNTAADLKEFWHTGRTGAAGSPHEAIMRPTPSVSEVDDFDAASRALFDALDAMGAQLLRAVALHLGLEEHWFDDRVREGNSILRLLHYPPQTTPPPPGSVRAGAHEDINVITLLLGAEEAGLQVRHRSGEWLSVNPPAGALVVNVGDMLQRLTGGVLPSTTHRVLNPSPERARFPRYSTPFFLHFAPDVMIEPLPQCLAEGGKAFAPISAQDYLMERLREIGLVKT